MWDAEPVSDAGWERFANAFPLDAAWQGRHLHAGGGGPLRDHGSPAAFRPFAALADGGRLALARLETLAEAHVTLGNSGSADGWVEAVVETALSVMTPALRVECDRWGLPEAWPDGLDDSGPVRYPLHPCVQSLSLDVSASSAAATRLRLDPSACVTVGRVWATCRSACRPGGRPPPPPQRLTARTTNWAPRPSRRTSGSARTRKSGTTDNACCPDVTSPHPAPVGRATATRSPT